MPRYGRATLSAEDRHVLRRWTRGILVFYGVLALTAIGVATLNYHSVNSAVERASAEVNSPVSASNRLELELDRAGA